MGKPTGFLEYKRELPKDRPPLERINDWNEFHLKLDEEHQKIQGARCMDCGTPFCHSGMLLNGLVSGCPLNNLIPEWNGLIYKGLWSEALKRILMTNNFPEFTGRVCPAPCEGSCTVGLNDPQVTIKANECSIIDRAYEEELIKPRLPKRLTGKKVAVVGSGPSGLACADELCKKGHSVTVFERSDRVGGLLMYGIPNMKLDKSIIKRRTDIMEAQGVKFICNTEVGKNYPALTLLLEFDAVVLCCGATKPRDLNVEGRNLNGVHFAVDFLHANTKSLLDSNHMNGKYILAKDKNVIVIGGGDTGGDCVATSLRHKCKSLAQFEILPKPALEREKNNPWPEWPKVFKVDYGHEEYEALYGRDPREFSIMTKKFVGNSLDNIKEVHTVNIEWKKDLNGRFSPCEAPGTEKIWPADLVLICMGFLGPEDNIIKDLNIKQDERSNVLAEYGKFKTNNNKIFAAGDMRRGQSLVAWAINEGRLAAHECDNYLSNI